MKHYFSPVILGRECSTPSDLLVSLSFVRGNNMAKAAFEMAFCDLSAKEEGVSLSKFLLGTKSKVESGVSVGIQKDAKRLVEDVSDYLDQCYQRIKIKIKTGYDVDEVSILRLHV